MRTELIQLDGVADAARITHAAQILRSGGLVAFPTETVYALGADARNPEALARLAKVKGKLDGKNYSLLVGSMLQAEQLAGGAGSGGGGLSRTARKLARLYWPGMLTLVVPRAGGGNVGLRIPQHPVARSLIAQCGFPVAAPNATLRTHKGNEHVGRSESPSYLLCDGLSAAQVRTAFDGRIDLVLEGGAQPKGKLSTVVEVSDQSVSVQREGAIAEVDVLLAAVPTILFICTGNTCRSPMAAGLWRAALADFYKPLAPEMRILSAGTNATPGQPAHPHSIAAMKEIGFDISDHRATMLTPELVDSADWIFTMTRAHRDSIIEFMPSCANRVHLIAKEEDEIAEPGGRSLERYRQCRDKLARCLLHVLTTIERLG